MKILKNVSFHPKLAAVLEVVAGLGFALGVGAAFTWWQVLLTLVGKMIFSAVLVQRVYNPLAARRLTHWLTIIFFNVGILGIQVFSEWSSAKYVMGMVLALGPALTFWFFPSTKTELPFALKPYRRISFALVLLGLAGFWSAIWAVVIFRIYPVSFWVLNLGGVGVTLAVSCWWWKEYKVENTKLIRTWLLVFLVLFFELSWVLFHTPLAYFIRGIVLVWVWCVLWLLARFSLLSEGVNWKKFFPVLMSNMLGIALFLGIFASWK